jgi:hypothetical protein
MENHRSILMPTKKPTLQVVGAKEAPVSSEEKKPTTMEKHLDELNSFDDKCPDVYINDITTLITFTDTNGDQDTVMVTKANMLDLYAVLGMAHASVLDGLRRS